VQNLNQANSEWRYCRGDNGEHKHVHVTSANIGSILESFTRPPDPNFRDDTRLRLDHASFEIRVFDRGVRERIAELCQYARRLKINFRTIPTEYLDTWLSEPKRDEKYNRIVRETLSVLKTAPRLLSLHLHFGIEVRRIWMMGQPYVRHRPICPELLDDQCLTMLGGLWAAPALSRLYINLANNKLGHSVVVHLVSLRHSATLNVLSINLDDNHPDLLHNISDFGDLTFATNIGTLHLSLRNFKPLREPSIHVEREFVRMLGDFRNAGPSLQKLYLNLENNGLTEQSLREIARIRVPTLHLGLGFNTYGERDENRDRAIRILNDLGGNVELICDLADPYICLRLAQVGIVPPWSVGTFMDGFIHWNQLAP
jgi:hypothetical protein